MRSGVVEVSSAPPCPRHPWSGHDAAGRSRAHGRARDADAVSRRKTSRGWQASGRDELPQPTDAAGQTHRSSRRARRTTSEFPEFRRSSQRIWLVSIRCGRFDYKLEPLAGLETRLYSAACPWTPQSKLRAYEFRHRSPVRAAVVAQGQGPDDHRRADPGARHRRQRRHLQRGSRRPAQAAGEPRRRRA